VITLLLMAVVPSADAQDRLVGAAVELAGHFGRGGVAGLV
jgi:hypothetical protein